MDDARRQELLAKFPLPWSQRGSGFGPEKSWTVATTATDDEDDRMGLAALLVEAFNAHFGDRFKPDFLAKYAEIFSLVGGDPTDHPKFIGTLLAWKRKAEELDKQREDEQLGAEFESKARGLFNELQRENSNRAARAVCRALGQAGDLAKVNLVAELIYSSLRERDASQ